MCPNAVGGGTSEGGNIRESIPSVSRFWTDEPEGESCEFAMIGMCADERAAHPDLSHRSEQLSCTKYFHPSYGLFYIHFQSLLHFLELI